MNEDIYGPSIPNLKGKTVQHKVQNVDPVKITSVPKTIIYRYKEFTICCNLMHINGIGFLNTILRHIMFATGIMIKTRKINNIVDGMTQVHKLYLHRGFNITHMNAVSKLKPLCREMVSLGFNLNYESKKKQVPEIEHFIQNIN